MTEDILFDNSVTGGKTLYELSQEVDTLHKTVNAAGIDFSRADANRVVNLVNEMKKGIREMEKVPVLAGEIDPNGRKANEPGAKLDSGKVRPWLCIAGFSRALEEVARVTTKGAEKYTPNGWCKVPNGEERYMEAFGRHLLEYGKGEKFDSGPKGLGSDIYHKAQMIWNLLASLELELRNGK